MYRAKRQRMDIIPQSLEDLAIMLGQPNNRRFVRTLDDHPFYLGHEAHEVHIDGTFKVRPNIPPSRQLLTVHIDGTFKVRPNIPPSRQLLTVMTSANSSSYISLFRFLRDVAPQLNPTVVVTDFEKGLQVAVRTVFPNAHLVVYWFHSANAMRKRARLLGMTALLHENPVAHKIVKMTMSLPLLPHDAIPAGMRAIRQHALRNDELKNIENTYSRAYANGGQPRATPPAYLAQNRRIAEATELYVTGEYTVLQFLRRASHVVMDAVVNPNDGDDPDDGVAHPPPPSPIGVPPLLEDPVEPIAEPRRRKRAPEVTPQFNA
ncbi:hypothetical protein J6590_077145 [Homalodisca vitripennis]|nr:hypothetical protein J6590_077145 [Homalodisca vitripennis]